MVLAAQIVQRFEYAYGASIAFRREALDRIGGFAALADYLADDYLLGNRIAKAGYRLVLLPYTVETVLDAVSLRDVWRHLLRWSRTYAAQEPVGWFASVVTHATLWGGLAVVATGGSALGLGACATALGVRLVSLALVQRILREPDTARWLWLVPLKDVLTSLVWAGGFSGRTVTWSGQVLRIQRDGRMIPVLPAAHPIPASNDELEKLSAAGG